MRANYYYLIGLMRDSMRKGSTYTAFPDNRALRSPIRHRGIKGEGGRGRSRDIEAASQRRVAAACCFATTWRISEDPEHLGETSILLESRRMSTRPRRSADENVEAEETSLISAADLTSRSLMFPLMIPWTRRLAGDP